MTAAWSLAELLDRLKASPRVRGIFTYGSSVTGGAPWSDLDLVILLDRNAEGIQSVFTTIEGKFSDIFFFDIPFLEEIKKKPVVAAHALEGMFIGWLATSRIEHDPDGVLAATKAALAEHPPHREIPDGERWGDWSKINYDFITNARYWDSGDPLYHRALEIRLLYGVMDLLVAWFMFRGLPWKGEKAAIQHWERHDPGYLAAFQACVASRTLEERMARYRDLFGLTCVGEYRKWEDGFVIPKATPGKYAPELRTLWEGLIGIR